MAETLHIEAWTSDHSRWDVLMDVVESHQQAAWVAAVHPWHRSSLLVEGEHVLFRLRIVLAKMAIARGKRGSSSSERINTKAPCSNHANEV